MIIQHNLAAMATSRHLGIQNKGKASTTEKLSSGYKINRAADNSTGLSISEKMRGQIKGLERASFNADEGMGFVRTADGAMDEMSNLLQRMRELSVASCTDTYTDEDRAALQAELDQLQSEIDRISTETEFNAQKVFEQHEATFYCIEGNQIWDQGQPHNVENGYNDFIITINDGTNDITHTVTVPPGIYTTQELAFELEEALENQLPNNPGFILEFSKDGTFNFIYEGGDDVKSVGGSLSYLIYDNYKGGSFGSLLGTTQFVGNYPLNIVSGKNDVLEFYLEDLVGNSQKHSITVPQGNYTRQQMIDELNKHLPSGVDAEAHGDNCIKINGNDHMVTGLKGNMFEIDGPNWSSIFYDNTKGGTVSHTNGYLIGRAYYTTNPNDVEHSKIKITSANKELYIRVNGKAGDNFVKITLAEKEYTVSEMADALNAAFLVNNIDAEAKMQTNGSFQYLRIDSKALGEGSKIEIDTSQSTAYDTLFRKTAYFQKNTIYSASGINYTIEPTLTGRKVLSAPIKIEKNINDTLRLNVDGVIHTITIPPKNNYTVDELVAAVNGKISTSNLNGKIILKSLSGVLQFMADPPDNGVNSISFASPSGSAYTDLFQGVAYQNNPVNVSGSGTNTTPPKVSIDYPSQGNVTIDSTNNKFVITVDGQQKIVTFEEGKTYTPQELVDEMNKQLQKGATISIANVNVAGQGSATYLEGTTIPSQTKPATVTFPNDLVNPMKIDSSNDSFTLTINGNQETIKLTHGTYTPSQMASMLNDRFSANGLGVKADLNGNKLRLTTTAEGPSASLKVNSSTGGTAMLEIAKQQINNFSGVTVSIENGKLVFTGQTTGYGKTIAIHSGNGGGGLGIFVGTTPVTLNALHSMRYTNKRNSNIQGRPISGAGVTIDAKSKDVNFTYYDNGTAKVVQFTLDEKYYSFADLQTALQAKIDTAVGGSGKVNVTVGSNGVRIESANPGPNYNLTGFSGGFHTHVIGQSKVVTTYTNPAEYNGVQIINGAYIVGRQDVVTSPIKIEQGKNDKLIMDLTIPNGSGGKQTITLEMLLTPGTYDGDSLKGEIQKKINDQLKAKGLKENLIQAGIGGINTGIVGSNDATALNFKISNTVGNVDPGSYRIDGVRGSSAFYIFYKSIGEPVPAYTIGVNDISAGVEIKPSETEFSFTADGVEYKVDFPDGEYTADEVIKFLNQELSAQNSPVQASLEDGKLKLSYTKLGTHIISDITGFAKGVLFYSEYGKVDQDQSFMLQIGANTDQSMNLGKIKMNTNYMKINGITISKAKYADKALERLDRAMDYLNKNRSNYGAKYNRLEHVVAGNDNTAENMQNSESKLRDADMASEMVRYSKFSILEQVGQSMLAQANQSTQKVLDLLR